MSYLDTARPLPYCPGCGHPHVLRGLDDALVRAGLPAERIVLVTDIGCVGLADAHFPSLHTVHTLHGRSTAIAAGIRMAARGEGLKPVVLLGDGGASIGLLHLVHAAQLDVDVTVLLHNNLLYGMTGGQHSTLTPAGMATSTTPEGCPVPAVDLAAVLGGAGLRRYARARVPGDRLADLLAEALQHPGFAVVEALELCPTFAARLGGVTGTALRRMADERGEGWIVRGDDRERPVPPGHRPGDHDAALPPSVRVDARRARLDRRFGVAVAGRAGERVQSAARLLAVAGLAAGLEATVRTDNPVTQGRGFSLAEVTLAPEPIHFAGMERPDVLLVTAPEGLAELRSMGRLRPGGAARVVVDESLADEIEVPVERRDLRRRHGAKDAALGGLVELALEEDLFDAAAWEEAGRVHGQEGRTSLALERARAAATSKRP